MGHDLALRQIVPAALQSPPPPPPTSLAPGFRFHPTDEELVQFYLKRKTCGKPFRYDAVIDIDVYKAEPWELQVHSKLKNRDLEWYFFSPVDKKYGNGSRLNRATDKGYWKATGKDRCVSHKDKKIGMKKTLVFHSGRAPDGKRTNWVMHEYRLTDEDLEKAGVVQDAFVLCRIFQKSGLGPPNGDRYAPFIEEEWDDEAPLNDAGDEMGNRDDSHFLVEANDREQDDSVVVKASPLLTELPDGSRNIHLACKREMIVDPEPISLGQSKRRKHDDLNMNNGNNGSEDSITTNHDLCKSTTAVAANNFSSALLEFPLLASRDPKVNQHANTVPFHASNLEKSVPPGYLKFISNLEHEILNVSMERETLKIEMMRAQAMINVMQSRIDTLDKENDELRKVVRGP
ncbi:NAC domain containing protein 50-like [Impatiens glandulifera]|uniref:NAC domain containing protein 50-like n=1 Tax=Impatiens glandulifera TaxID=253017 RepID=UPI001FB15307|nr:NAC domain containing protein 50-like [Impatiens glandulifera]